MKTILIFSNPFGYGPAGKALSIGNFIKKKNPQVKVYLCGGPHLKSITKNECDFIYVDERDTFEIVKIIENIQGSVYVFSSQNRFAIKAARICSVPSAFLDGLAWFWRKIPDEHFEADIIFWFNYLDIHKKIPKKHKSKIYLIGKLSSRKKEIKNRNQKIIFYIGGCKNPLTNLPTNYLNLISNLITSLPDYKNIEMSSDYESCNYYTQNKLPVSHIIKTYSHTVFLKKLLKTKKIITNGGQTTVQESINSKTNISFFLPVNLSQEYLIKNLIDNEKKISLRWSDYISDINLNSQNEKEGIKIIENASLQLLTNSKKLRILQKDFKKLIQDKGMMLETSILFKNMTNTGIEELYTVLKKKWDI